MNALLEEIISETYIHIQFLFKYINDLFLSVQEEDIDKLFKIFNSKCNLGFTKEIENGNRISFLGVEIITTINYKLEFKWE